MPRARRTGTISAYRPARPGEPHGRYVVRVTAPDGSRPTFALDPSPKSPQARARALEHAAAISERLWRDGLGAAPRRGPKPTATPEDADRWFEAWLDDRKRRGLVVNAAGPLRVHIRAELTGHPKDWTPADLRRLCAALDGKVLAGELAWKTAQNVWGLATRICRDACSSKAEALRVREDNPAAGVAGPDRGTRKGKPYLYPSEVLAFVSCDDVPMPWRRAVAVAVYTYVRASELRALDLRVDFDAAHGVLHVHHSLDGAGNAKPTKSKRPRRFAVEPPIVPLLRSLARVEMPATQQNLSVVLRRLLRVAGVTREALHVATATSLPITWHDLRATGITWCAVRGDDPLKIMQRAGHADFATTQRYIREAEALRAGFGAVFPPLPDALLPPRGGGRPSRDSSQAGQVRENTVRRRGLEPPRELPR